jgi:hypothetical protein
MHLLTFLLAAAASVPHPGEIKTFQDWSVGCDNGKACQASALVPEDWPDDALTMSVARGAEAGAVPAIAIDLGSDAKATSLAADGRVLPVKLVAPTGTLEIEAADVPTVVAAMRSASQLEIRVADGTLLGRISLKGVSAALLYMDEQQRRIGTTSALVRPGTRTTNAVPPPLPVVVAQAPTKAAALPFGAAEIKALRRKHGCTIDEVGGPDEADIAALGPGESLLLLACGSGAYNVSHIPFSLRRAGVKVRAELADFDISPDWWGEEKHPVLINADWAPEQALLGSFSKARGLGDCGTISSFAWDGTSFRLVEQAEMRECRGSLDYITTWRAEVRRR